MARAAGRSSAAKGRAAGRKEYDGTLRALQVELVKYQKHLIECADKVLVILEGRDASDKDGAIKRIIQHLSPRETCVVALGKPSDRDRNSWYFQRYAQHLPAAGEMVLFNRSWYNRAGVERVMGFCMKSEYEEFMDSVLGFEYMLVHSGIRLFKYYLDIGKAEQERRLKQRRRDSLKQWKVSPVDQPAVKRWKAYRAARNEMLARTHDPMVPWTVVRADDKRLARLNVIRDMLTRLHYPDKAQRLILPHPKVAFAYDQMYIDNGMIAR